MKLSQAQLDLIRELEEKGRNEEYPIFAVFWDYSYLIQDEKTLEEGHTGKDFKRFDEAAEFYAHLDCKRKQINMYLNFDAPTVIVLQTKDAMLNWCKELK